VCTEEPHTAVNVPSDNPDRMARGQQGTPQHAKIFGSVNQEPRVAGMRLPPKCFVVRHPLWLALRSFVGSSQTTASTRVERLAADRVPAWPLIWASKRPGRPCGLSFFTGDRGLPARGHSTISKVLPSQDFSGSPWSPASAADASSSIVAAQATDLGIMLMPQAASGRDAWR